MHPSTRFLPPSPWYAAAAAVLSFGLLLAAGVARAQPLPAPENVVNLTASASAEVANDLLTVVFSTRREGPDAGPVQAQLKQALDAALAEARRAANAANATTATAGAAMTLRTGSFSLTPRYTAKGGASGWVGQAELVVEGRDAQAVAQLTGRIQTMSIARVGWSLSREAREKVEDEVAAQAIAGFRAKADRTARLFGFTGWLLREVSVGSDTPQMYARPMAMAARADNAEMQAPLPVEAGQATVTGSVSGSVQLTR